MLQTQAKSKSLNFRETRELACDSHSLHIKLYLTDCDPVHFALVAAYDC